jgi:hypothetical protein
MIACRGGHVFRDDQLAFYRGYGGDDRRGSRQCGGYSAVIYSEKPAASIATATD